MKKKKTIILLIIAVIIIAVGAAAYWFLIVANTDDSAPEQSTQSSANQPASDKDVASVIADTGSLSSLNDAIMAASLSETLKTVGPYTVIAPNNSAFNALPPGTMDRFLKPENLKQLQNLTNYFVISGNVLSSQLTNGQRLTTLNGQELLVELADSNVYFIDAKGNKALVIKADMKAKNGVIHIVDTVVLPQ